MSTRKDAPTVPKTARLNEVLVLLQNTGAKLVVVLDGEMLAGVITDGDVRRALMRAPGQDLPVAEVMNPKPIAVGPGVSKLDVLTLMREREIEHVVVADGDGRFLDLYYLRDLLGWGRHVKDAPVVLMAGGLGTRLRPLTNHQPKPMIEVAGRPILETTIAHFRFCGYRRFFISVRYLAEMIEEYFGDGSDMGVEITYLRETEPRGTAGCLSLARDHLTGGPFLLMNGDVMTSINPTPFLEFHGESQAPITVAAHVHEYTVPFGVLEEENGRLRNVSEKPSSSFLVNAGIYALSDSVLDMVPKDAPMDMPELINGCIAAGQSPAIYRLREAWLDIGRPSDLAKAEEHYTLCFPHLSGA